MPGTLLGGWFAARRIRSSKEGQLDDAVWSVDRYSLTWPATSRLFQASEGRPRFDRSPV